VAVLCDSIVYDELFVEDVCVCNTEVIMSCDVFLVLTLITIQLSCSLDIDIYSVIDIVQDRFNIFIFSVFILISTSSAGYTSPCMIYVVLSDKCILVYALTMMMNYIYAV